MLPSADVKYPLPFKKKLQMYEWEVHTVNMKKHNFDLEKRIKILQKMNGKEPP